MGHSRGLCSKVYHQLIQSIMYDREHPWVMRLNTVQTFPVDPLLTHQHKDTGSSISLERGRAELRHDC